MWHAFRWSPRGGFIRVGVNTLRRFDDAVGAPLGPPQHGHGFARAIPLPSKLQPLVSRAPGSVGACRCVLWLNSCTRHVFHGHMLLRCSSSSHCPFGVDSAHIVRFCGVLNGRFRVVHERPLLARRIYGSLRRGDANLVVQRQPSAAWSFAWLNGMITH